MPAQQLVSALGGPNNLQTFLFSPLHAKPVCVDTPASGTASGPSAAAGWGLARLKMLLGAAGRVKFVAPDIDPVTTVTH